MNGKNIHRAAAEAAIQEGVAAEVKIMLEKKPGEARATQARQVRRATPAQWATPANFTAMTAWI